MLKLARENNWGYCRILGELKKLGVGPISKNTVKRILKEHGLEPGPKRGWGTWDEFLKCHAVSLWQTDFLSRRVLTLTGFRDAYLLVFIHIKTRQVVLSPSTLHPDQSWVVEQTDRFVEQSRSRGLRVGWVQHDSDTKYGVSFQKSLRRKRVERIRNQFRAPNLNAYVERFNQSIQRECLDEFLIFGTKHLDYLCNEYLAHYHEERPHQSLGNRPVLDSVPIQESDVVPLWSIRRKQRLGGLLKSYRRQAA